jgi:hypothetical protein
MERMSRIKNIYLNRSILAISLKYTIVLLGSRSESVEIKGIYLNNS